MRKSINSLFTKLTAVLTTAVLLSLATGCATLQPEPEVIQNYEQAKRLYDRSRYDEAVTAFDAFLQEYPQSELSPAAMYYKARSHQEAEQVAQARNVYQALIDQYKTGPWVDLAKANLEDLN